MSDMWFEASGESERIYRESALALADAELEAVMPFLLAARSPQEYAHRSALAQDSIRSIAARCGIDETELMATAQRRYELYRQALQEGQDPLEEVVRASESSGYGSGPEKPVEHDTAADFSHSYGEVPELPSPGPNPAVTRPRPPMMGPVQEATGSLRRQADATPGSMMMPSSPSASPAAMPSSSMGAGPNLPAGVGGTGSAPSAQPDMTPAPDVASSGGLQNFTSSKDQVRRRVMAVTAAVRETNPHLPEGECERVARKIVGRYLRSADLTSSVMDDKPVGGGDSGSQDGSGGGHGMSGVEEYGLGRAVVKAAPEMLAAL